MSATLTIRILDKDFQVNCPPDEQEALLESARQLDQQMKDIRRHGHVIGMDRIAVMAALNLTHDLLRAQRQIKTGAEADNQLAKLDQKIADALNALEG